CVLVTHPPSRLMTSSSESTSESEGGIAPYWFAVFELVYIAIFVGVSLAIHLFGLLKTDEDAVTIHHRMHREIIAQQEKKFMSQKKENFVRR
ncbi:hypothetical protein V3C99_004360, partial [Haemonchus contortus]